MKTWYRKISRDLDRPQGYLPRFNTDEREEPKPQTVTSPIIDTVETEEENSRTEEDSQSAHTTSPQTTSFKNKDEFKATMLPIYAKILSQMGLNTAYAKMLVAQDGLESAWGTKPSGKFNFGGIKGTGSIKRTREVIDGKDVYINDSFRDFASLEDYAKYKISLLNNNRYKAFTGDLSGFADRVSRGGYATDPNYAETLKRVIASAKHGGILKFQAGGTGEIRPDNRSWFKRKWDDIATAYNSSSWANSAPASIIAGFTPYGLFHYSASGDEDSARLAVLPGAVGTKEVAKNAVKAAEEGVNLVYRHYGNDISKYFQGALKWLRNARKGSIPAAERLEVPKQISKIRLGNPKHDYAFFKDAKTGETILEISPTAQNPLRSGEKAASKQFLQELVGTKDDFGLRGLSYAEKELFPKKFLSAMTQENSAKDIYSKIMSYKAEAGIKSSFTELTEAEARKIFDIGWDANLFYPNWRVPLKKDPLPQKKYNVKRNYDKKAINDYGESYYDIVKTRVRDAHDALIRNGFSEDVKRLQEPLSAVSIKETGWRLTDPKNNYFGLLINGGKKASYKTKEESWDATIAYLNKRYGIGNLNGPWWESDSIEDFVNRINNPELDTTLHSQEDYDRYNRDRVTSGETPQYMHAPYWNNRNKRYNDEVKDIIDRYYGYYYME